MIRVALTQYDVPAQVAGWCEAHYVDLMPHVSNAHLLMLSLVRG
jgi:hypothetical protein